MQNAFRPTDKANNKALYGLKQVWQGNDTRCKDYVQSSNATHFLY